MFPHRNHGNAGMEPLGCSYLDINNRAGRRTAAAVLLAAYVVHGKGLIDFYSVNWGRMPDMTSIVPHRWFSISICYAEFMLIGVLCRRARFGWILKVCFDVKHKFTTLTRDLGKLLTVSLWNYHRVKNDLKRSSVLLPSFRCLHAWP